MEDNQQNQKISALIPGEYVPNIPGTRMPENILNGQDKWGDQVFVNDHSPDKTYSYEYLLSQFSQPNRDAKNYFASKCSLDSGTGGLLGYFIFGLGRDFGLPLAKITRKFVVRMGGSTRFSRDSRKFSSNRLTIWPFSGLISRLNRAKIAKNMKIF